MRRLIIVLGVLLISISLQAKEDWRASCKVYAKLAYETMDARQSGISMVDMIEAAEGQSSIEQVITAAYEVPRYSTERYREQAIQDFTDKVYLGCVKKLQRK